MTGSIHLILWEKNKVITNPTICTIVAKNYVAFARVLCNSFLAQHPDGKVWVLIIDDIAGFVEPGDERFNVIRPDELDITNLNGFCFKYNITELATAFKPYFIEYLFNKKNVSSLLYLDPDILVTAPLTKLFDLLEGNSEVLLTPHLDRDYPDDGMLPDDSHIMKSGIYNLGFIGIRRSAITHAFLQWWQNKLYDHCVIDHAAGYFVDQKFIDYAFPIFDCFTAIKDQGYNVAYWNLHSRKIRKNGNQWMCNEGPLFFFHFSDFKPQRPNEISGHQNRLQLSMVPELSALFKYYLHCLNDNNYHSSSQWPYTHKFYTSGEIIDPEIRKLYRLYGASNQNDPFDSSNSALAIYYQRNGYLPIKKMLNYLPDGHPLRSSILAKLLTKINKFYPSGISKALEMLLPK